MGHRFLGGLFETKKANQNQAVLRAAGRSMSMAGMPLPATVGQWDMEKAVKDGIEKVGMVYRCVDAIAQTQSRIPMDIRMMKPGLARDQGDLVDSDGLWSLLNFRANPYESSAMFRYRLSATLLLSRRGAFVEMVKDKMGNVVQLHLMSPGMVEPIPHPEKFVSGYQIMRGDWVVDVVEPERVCWIKIKPHPIDPYSQLTPLMSAGISADTDWLARNFNRAFLGRDGRPGMLITIQGQINPEDAEEIKARFQGGYDQAGRTSVIEADGLEVADLAANPRDLQWSELIASSKQDIQLAFGVPESVMGNASGRTFDNADAERENFYVDTIQPHCEPIAFGLDPITGETDDKIVVAYNYSSVDVLQRMAARKREEWRAEVSTGLKTIDEYRDAAGMDEFDVVGTRVLYHTSGLAIAKTPEDQAGIMEYRTVGTPPEEGLQAADAAEQGAMRGIANAKRETDNTYAAQAVGERRRTVLQSSNAQRRIQGGRSAGSRVNSGNRQFQRALALAKSFGDGLETKTEKARTRRKEGDPAEDDRPPRARAQRRNETGLAAHPYLGLRTKMEGIIEGAISQWDMRQEEVVASRLDHAKFRKGTRHWEEKELPKKQKCKFCAEQATKRIIHSEGMAYIPVCESHLAKGKDAAATCTPDGTRDPSNIDSVRDIKNDLSTTFETKALDPSYAVDARQWAKDLESGLSSFLIKAMTREAKTALRELEDVGVGNHVQLPTDSQLTKMLDPAYGEVMSIIRTAANNQSVRLMDAIKEMDKEGASIKDIERKVRQMTGTRAPWRKQLAVNATTAAIESARATVYERAGKYYEKVWNAERDERTRHTHKKADGQTRPVNKPFVVGGHKMMAPGDPGAPIEETANCRCFASFYPSKAFDDAEANR